MQWQTVIGLEIHVQLATKSKLFSGASTTYGAKANIHACAIDLGLPGVLPVINQQAIVMAIKFGLAIDAKITQKSVFARKNYFYPDLPKGYQISQSEFPIINTGSMEIELADGKKKTIGIHHAHLEEDAGKSVHDHFADNTGIDLNRAGTPLLEIVSEPDLNTTEEVTAYLKKIHSIVRHLKISDGNMQEGSFRCDANVSIKPKDQKKLGIRTELKNLNSFKFIEQAINYEVARQIDTLESGNTVIQETRLYDSDNNTTHAMRSKEEANDYRYFPDPDLLPIHINHEFIEMIRQELPELPDKKYQRFREQYNLSQPNSVFLTQTQEQAEYFESTVKASNGAVKLSANWIMGELSAFLNKNNQDITNSPVSPEMLGNMIQRIQDNTISNKIAKQVFEYMWNGEGNADEIIESKQLKLFTNQSAIQQLIDTVIAEHQDQVQKYPNLSPDKQKKLISFFVGQIMKKSSGKADAKQIKQLFEEKLAE